MPDAEATPPTDPRPDEPAEPAEPAEPTIGLARPAIAPLVTLGSEDADACSDGLCS